MICKAISDSFSVSIEAVEKGTVVHARSWTLQCIGLLVGSVLLYWAIPAIDING